VAPDVRAAPPARGGRPGLDEDFDRRHERPIGARNWDAQYSDALNDALHTAELIADRHNFNESRIEEDYFHVGYYLTVNANHVRRVVQHALAFEFDPAFRALFEKAAEAARTLPKNVVKAECGKAGVEFMSKWTCERILKLAERANGRPLVYDKRRGTLGAGEGGRVIACSSCGATGVRIDLDVRATPPEHVCVKCKRMPKCDELPQASQPAHDRGRPEDLRHVHQAPRPHARRELPADVHGLPGTR
jgi:hypothetical protein